MIQRWSNTFRRRRHRLAQRKLPCILTSRSNTGTLVSSIPYLLLCSSSKLSIDKATVIKLLQTVKIRSPRSLCMNAMFTSDDDRGALWDLLY